MRYPPPIAPVHKMIRIDAATMQRVQAFRFAQMLPTEAEAFRWLINAGLQVVEADKPNGHKEPV